ncbi:hypothetical protein [Bauldia litoralis]|uniref:Uncharacterized protein n=1 Tax=Bauldia litoralis TaxID=665467 RepID=A0A1G6DGG7_9HYPH|nr:hypothetical protein [Bauldia litoralis]SDB44222.1 hypothetical protein SAMN02982931_03361 [Bauldia litoralis]
MTQIILVGIAAGVAGALLFLSPIGGTTLAFPLFTLCGLPIALAGLGWGATSALTAALVAAAILTIALSGSAAIIYLALFAGPIFWMTRLASLSRQDDPDSADVEWYPIGRILFQGALAAAIGIIIVGFVVGYDPAAITDEMIDALAGWMAQSPEVAAPPTVADIEPFVRFNVAAMPFTVSAILVIILVFNMWLASRVTEASGRLKRPRPAVWTAALPREAVIVLAAAIVVAILAPGAIGQVAGTFVGALAAALALVGLAVLHATTFANAMRIPILVTVYVVLIMFGFPILLLAILGIVETFIHMRDRRLGGAPPNQ